MSKAENKIELNESVSHLYDMSNAEVIEIKSSRNLLNRLLIRLTGERAVAAENECLRLREHHAQATVLQHKNSNVSGFSMVLNLFNFKKFGKRFNKVIKNPVRVVSFTFLDLLVDLAFCILYLFEMAADDNNDGVWWQVNRPLNIYYTAIGLSVYTVVSFLLRIILADNGWRSVINWTFLLEIISTVPFFISLAVVGSVGPFFIIPYFIRAWVLNERIKKVLQLQADYRFFGIRIKKIVEKILVLFFSIATIIYLAMTTFQYVESAAGGPHYDVLTSFYFIVITISTVGYGDFSPETSAGRVVIIIIIFSTIAVVPNLIGETSAALSESRPGSDDVVISSHKIVIVMCMSSNRDKQIVDLLAQLLHEEMDELRVVLFMQHDRSQYLADLFKLSKYEKAVTYVRGDINQKDLTRAGFYQADACFVIAGEPKSTKVPDIDNIMRIWAILSYVPDIKLYVYTVSPDANKFILNLVSATICINEFTQLLQAYNSLYEGSGTLLTNLLIQSGTKGRLSKLWLHQYSDGLGNEVYSMDVPPCLIGRPFNEAAYFLFEVFQVIAVAINTSSSAKHSNSIFLNPGSGYKLKNDEKIIFLAQEFDDIKYIHTYDQNDVEQHLQVGMENAAPRVDLSFHKIDPTSTGYVVEPAQPRYDLFNESEAQLCVLNKKATTVESARLKEGMNLINHILICSDSYDVSMMMTVFRSTHLDMSEFFTVLIMVDRAPTPEEWKPLSRFPQTFYMVGDSVEKSDLQKAGVLNCKTVILDVSSHGEDVGNFTDGRAVITSKLIETMAGRDEPKKVIVNLQSRQSVSFFDVDRSEDEPAIDPESVNDDLLYSDAYAAGRVVVPPSLNAVLVQNYISPFILELVSALCGGATEQSIRKSEEVLNKKQCHLTSFNVPLAFHNKTFKELFYELAINHEIIPIGLFRKNIGVDNKLPFVYTNPVGVTVLFPGDQVFAIVQDD